MLHRQNGGLEQLLRRDPEAQRFYGSLPSYVQDLIQRQPRPVKSEAQLRQSAAEILENLHY